MITPTLPKIMIKLLVQTYCENQYYWLMSVTCDMIVFGAVDSSRILISPIRQWWQIYSVAAIFISLNSKQSNIYLDGFAQLQWIGQHKSHNLFIKHA